MAPADPLARFDRFPGLPPRAGALRLFVVRTLPSFHARRAWALYGFTKDGGTHTVRRVTARPVDGELVHVGHDAVVDAELAASLVQGMEELQIPVHAPVKALGLDGVSYEVETGSYMAGMKLRWWREPPDAWAEVAAWHGRVVEALDPLLPRVE